MAIEALSSSTELLNFIIHDTISPTPFIGCNNNDYYSSTKSGNYLQSSCSSLPASFLEQGDSAEKKQSAGPGVAKARKKRKRRPKVCKNKEEAETQRMTHIAVERNRRKQMNEHLAVLRSLMPESFVQRGDQASIVGGAIDYVKELEHMLQNLEAQKFQLLQRGGGGGGGEEATNETSSSSTASAKATSTSPPFGQFFAYPQYTWSEFPEKYSRSWKSKAAVAEIEVTLIETHASVRILSRRRVRQLSSMVASFHTLYLTILHLNVTTLDPFVLYSVSAKVEEGCQFHSADDIAGAVHHILRIIEEEAALSN